MVSTHCRRDERVVSVDRNANLDVRFLFGSPPNKTCFYKSILSYRWILIVPSVAVADNVEILRGIAVCL